MGTFKNKIFFSTKSIVPVLFFVLLTLTSCIKPLSLGKIEEVQIDKISGENLKIVVYVPIGNPNYFKINLTEMNLDVSINGKLLGSVKNVSHFTIKANSNDSYKVPLNIKLENMLTSALTLFSAYSEKQVKIRLKGQIVAGSWFASKTFDIDEENVVDLNK
jgi:LEA14-like dessication related protein